MNRAKTKKAYEVKSIDNAVKDVDLSKRTVTGLFNSFFYIDSDGDMLLPGCAAKSIKERGVGSKKGNAIKHLKDHVWAENIARIDVLDEREVDLDGRKIQGIYHESYYPESTDSNDQLIKIQEGLYDSRSIGFQYEKLDFCDRDSDMSEHVANWEKYLPLAINPEEAEERGYFWAVKEIRLWEGSDVSFGANELTPLLGVKSADAPELLQTKLFNKLDVMNSLVKSGNLSDEGFHRLDMEVKQIKTNIATFLKNAQPSKKATVDKRPTDRGTGVDVEESGAAEFLKHLIKL